ncbi:MAG: transporter substrate-binding domain-containing protein [Hahellaceae bacterium]|nr:transporter substrate-binding domain-containing protein [Hahellaceae bacterium]MCP5168970.1 transporter substrate-binding domain-containing protein [Hahellaceae bacterium]
MNKLALTALMLLGCALSQWSYALDVKVCQTESELDEYRIELANLVLKKTKTEYGWAKIAPVAHEPDPTLSRCLFMLRTGKVDLVYVPPTDTLLADFEVIPVDILRGLLSYRVLVINQNAQNGFARLNGLRELQSYKGVYRDRDEQAFYKINRLPALEGESVNQSLQMIESNRADYIFTDLLSAWTLVDAKKDKYPALSVEDTLALELQYPIYFMVRKGNQRLKERLESGLDLVIKDGSFQALFDKSFGHIATQANMASRNVIPVSYEGADQVPVVDNRFWMH